MENKLFCCKKCNYATKRKYDLKRHHNALHIDNKNTTIDNKNTTIDNKNTTIFNKCLKCSKILSSKQYLQKNYN
jgi:hypothetical protein